MKVILKWKAFYYLLKKIRHSPKIKKSEIYNPGQPSRVNWKWKGTCKRCVIKSHQVEHRCVAYSNVIGYSLHRWFLVLTPCNCDVGSETEAEKIYVYCCMHRFIRPFLRPEWSRAATSSIFGEKKNMAGYLKVLSSLTRSAATISKSPAVLASASCQSLQQRNCEFSTSTIVYKCVNIKPR